MTPMVVILLESTVRFLCGGTVVNRKGDARTYTKDLPSIPAWECGFHGDRSSHSVPKLVKLRFASRDRAV